MYDPLECNHTMFKDAIVSTSDAQKVLDEMPSVVLWDEDRPPEPHMNSDLLQQLAQGGEDLIDEENKPTTELFFIDEFCHVHDASFISGLADDSINEVFAERPLETVIWGEAIDQVLLDDGKASNEQIAAEVQLVSKDTEDKVFHEIATEIIWDEDLLQSPNTHDGLLQLVSRPGEYLVAKEWKPSVELKINGKLAHVDGPSFILDLGMDVVHENFNEMHLADVIWDQELLHSPESHGLLLQVADGDELVHVQQEAGFDECLVADKRATIDLVINDLIPHDSDMDNVKHELAATNCQVSACEFSESETIALGIRQETIDACKVFTEMPCQEDTQLVEQVMSRVATVSKGPAHVFVR
jgi:hypothetical protein